MTFNMAVDSLAASTIGTSYLGLAGESVDVISEVVSPVDANTEDTNLANDSNKADSTEVNIEEVYQNEVISADSNTEEFDSADDKLEDISVEETVEDSLDEIEIEESMEETSFEEVVEESCATIKGEYTWSDTEGFLQVNVNNYYSGNDKKVAESVNVISVWGSGCTYTIANDNLPEDIIDSVASAVNSADNIVVTGGETRGRLDITTSDGIRYIIYNYSSKEECKYLYDMFHGKVVAVLGDSISTLQYNIPAGNDDWNYFNYPGWPKFTYDTVYWGDIITRFGAKQGTIEAWAGSTIGTNYHGMCNTSRLSRIGDKGNPDILLFYGGSNIDTKQEVFDSSADYAKIVQTGTAWTSTQKGYAVTLNKLRCYYPNTLIVQVIPYYDKAVAQEKSIRQMAEYYNIVSVDLCSLREREVIDKDNKLHPSPTGHKQIANYICEQLYLKQDESVYEMSEANRMITFDAETNGGVCAVTSMYGLAEGINDVTASKEGVAFKGWYTKPTGGTLVSDFKNIGFSTTVYAQFGACKNIHFKVVNARSASFESDGYSGDIYCSDCIELIKPGKTVPAYSSTIIGCEGTSITNDLLPDNWKWKESIVGKIFGTAGTTLDFEAVYTGPAAEAPIADELTATIHLEAKAHKYSAYGTDAHRCSDCGIVHKYPEDICPICHHEDCEVSGAHLFSKEGVCTICDYRCKHVINPEVPVEEQNWAINNGECILCHAKVSIPTDENGNPIVGEIPEQLWVTGVVDKSYTGSAILQPNMSVYWGCKLLKQNTDYTIKYINNVNAGNATVVINGKGNYRGAIKKTFTIKQLSLEDAKAFDEDITISVTGRMQKPTTIFTLEVAGKIVTLKSGIDYKYEYPSIVEADDYQVTIRGCGNYCGTKSINVHVVDDAIPVTSLTISKIPDQTYTGEEVKPILRVSYRNKALTYGDDYEVSYDNNIKVGTAIATITGKGDYAGTRNIAYKIAGFPISKASVVINDTNVVYTGNPIALNSVSLYINPTKTTQKELIKDFDYKVTYSNEINAGTGTIIFTGINGYSGTLKKPFKIKKVSMDDESRISIDSIGAVQYQKNGARPVVIVRDGASVLTEGVDYSVKYYNSNGLNDLSSSKKSYAVVIGKGNYTGTSSNVYFKIDKRPLADEDINITATDIVAQNKAGICKPVIKLTDRNGAVLKSGVDYDKNVEYTYKYFTKGVKWNTKWTDLTIDYAAGTKVDMKRDIIPAGTVIEATVTGTGAYEGTKSVTFRYVGKNISSARITIRKQNQIYADKSVILDEEDIDATIKINGVYEPLVLGKDYKIVGYKNNINAGTAKVTIAGIGAYGGTRDISFKIVSKSMDYNIKFDKNDPMARGKMSTITVPAGTKLPSNAYTLNGKNFKCWCTKPSVEDLFAQTYVNGEKFERKGISILSFGDDVTLYAIWE